MQVDVTMEDNDNTEEDPYLVENPTLVSKDKKLCFDYCNQNVYRVS